MHRLFLSLVCKQYNKTTFMINNLGRIIKDNTMKLYRKEVAMYRF